MLHDVVDGAADAVGERDLGVEAGNQGFEFRVVEDDADGFVAEEFAFHVVSLGGGDGGQDVGGCVAGFQGVAGGHLSRAVPQVQQPQFIAAFGQ